MDDNLSSDTTNNAVEVIENHSTGSNFPQIHNADDIIDNSGNENKKKRKMKSRSQRKRDRRIREGNASNNNEHQQVLSSNTDSHIVTKIVRLRLPQSAMINENSSVTDTNTSIRNELLTNNLPWIRMIEPYTYSFTSNVKGRWVGRTILDVYTTEFGSYPVSYYKMAIEQGRIQVSKRIVPITYVVQGNDVLSHTVHRHEPAVAISTQSTTNNHCYTDNDSIISVVANTNEILAVDKPSTMPVHPCGGYHHNTLMSILESMTVPNDSTLTTASQQLLYGKLHTVHRLDRLTSGLVILAKTSQVAKNWGEAIQRRDSCEKLYLARVRGKFLENLSESNDTTTSTGQPLPRLGLDNEDDSLAAEVSTGLDKNHTSSSKLPLYGEWFDEESHIVNDTATTQHTSNTKHNTHLSSKRKRVNKCLDQQQKKNKNESIAVKAARLRKTNALGYWITDHTNQIRNELTLSDVSSIEHTVDEWFNILETTKKSTNVSVTADTGSASDNNRLETNEQPYLWVHFACPVRIEQHKNGVCSAGTFDDVDDETYVATAKPAQTSFAIVRYNPLDDTTILLIRPDTGRTHQIRIHLQFLKHPIANDPNYGGTLWFGNPFGEQACLDAQRILRHASNKVVDQTNDKNEDDSNVYCIRRDVDVTTFQDDLARNISDEPATDNEINRIISEPQKDDESWDDFIRRTCVWCARMNSSNCNKDIAIRDDRDCLEFLVRSPGLWLHALRYTVNGTSFQAALPDWSR